MNSADSCALGLGLGARSVCLELCFARLVIAVVFLISILWAT
jgi:hypothetical protein